MTHPDGDLGGLRSCGRWPPNNWRCLHDLAELLGVAEHAHPVAPEIAIQIVTLLHLPAQQLPGTCTVAVRFPLPPSPAGNALISARCSRQLVPRHQHEALFMTPGIAPEDRHPCEDKAIDGVVHLLKRASTGTGRAVGFTQSGRVRNSRLLHLASCVPCHCPGIFAREEVRIYADVSNTQRAPPWQ